MKKLKMIGSFVRGQSGDDVDNIRKLSFDKLCKKLEEFKDIDIINFIGKEYNNGYEFIAFIMFEENN